MSSLQAMTNVGGAGWRDAGCTYSYNQLRGYPIASTLGVNGTTGESTVSCHVSRFASGRGANPLAILAPLTERETGALAWAGTRVKLARVGGAEEGKLITFAGGMSRFPIEQERR